MVKFDYSGDSAAGDFKLSGIFRGVFFGIILTIILLAVCAALFSFFPLPEGAMSSVIKAIVLISIAASGFVSSSRLRTRGWLGGAGSAVIYILIVYTAGFLIFGHSNPGGNAALFILFGILAGVLGGVLGINFSSQKR